MSRRRIAGIALRQWLTLRRSVPRIFDVFYWPTLEVTLWGLVTQYLLTQAGASFAPGLLIGGMILWTMLHRAAEDLSISFLEENWSQNFPNLFASPLNPFEYLAASMLVGSVKIVGAGAAVAGLAALLYGYGLWELGPTLLVAVPALVTFGWSIGLFTMGLTLRYGRQVDVLAWSLTIVFQPIGCAVYPLRVLPPELQVVAGLLPPTHVFEAARAAASGTPSPGELLIGLPGGLVCLSLGCVWYWTGVQRARVVGRLSSSGE